MVISGMIGRQFLDKSDSFNGGHSNGPCPVELMLRDTFPNCDVRHYTWDGFYVEGQFFRLNTVARDYIQRLGRKCQKPKSTEPFWVRLVEEKG